jgi:ABC-type multidrug transport system fused ATPase/permease subunit
MRVIPEGLRRPEVREVLRLYAGVAQVRAHQLTLALALAVGVMLLEAASYGLLVPLADAFAANSFEPVTKSRAFGWIPGLLPAQLRSSPESDGLLVLLLLMLIIGLRVVRAAVGYGLRMYMHRREERYIARIQRYTFERVLDRSRSFFDGRPLGHLDTELHWARAPVELLSEGERLIERTLSLLGKAIVLVALSLPLSLVLLAALPFIQAVAARIGSAIERTSRDGDRVERRIHGDVLDLLGSVSLVQASGAERVAVREYGSLLDQARALAVRRRDLQALRWPVEEVLLLLTLLVAQGVVILMQGTFRPGDLARTAAFLLLLSQMLPDFQQWGAFSTALSERLPRLEALADLIRESPESHVVSGPRRFAGLRTGVSLHGLRFAYRAGEPVLHDLDLELRAGHTTAIVGASGSGKSTLLRLIARMYECERGSLRFDDVAVQEFSLASVHERVALVNQDVWMLNRSLRDNLVYGLTPPPTDEELLAMLESVQLGEWAQRGPAVLDQRPGERGLRLSGGQRQRVALARALLRKPALLLLDEATAALDSLVEQRITHTLLDPGVDGRTVVAVAHRLSTVRSADQIVVLDRGRVIEQGSWSELLARDGTFAALHRAQFSAPEPEPPLARFDAQ